MSVDVPAFLVRGECLGQQIAETHLPGLPNAVGTRTPRCPFQHPRRRGCRRSRHQGLPASLWGVLGVLRRDGTGIFALPSDRRARWGLDHQRIGYG
jgi:hypothetical protein